MVQSVYVHIPFCEHICHYCDFNKVFLKNQPVDDYLKMLDIEMQNTLAKHPTNSINTIFLGGGTPTSLSLNQLDQLFTSIHRRFDQYMDENIEFTVEANPSHLPQEKLQLLKDAGVNRLSFGVQVFDDDLLQRIGRTHRAKDVYQTVHLAQDIGFENINVDLIYSLPGQTIESFKDTLKHAFTLGVGHFSGYSLQIEPKTVFYNLMKKGKLHQPTEEVEAEMYTVLIDEMESHGYAQYEISNFSKKGYESKHNLTYWNNEEYYGFGAGAHSYVNGVRRANAGPLKQYFSLIEKSGFPYIDEHQVGKKEKMEEEAFLGLRKTAGISKQIFHEKFSGNLTTIYRKEIDLYVSKGLLEETTDSIRLTRKGMLLGNEVFQAFIQ